MLLRTRNYFIFLTFWLSVFGSPCIGGRTHVHLVGSSTMYPCAVAVADSFHARTGLPTPVIESTGTGGGIKAFCSGLGDNTPDGVLASRPFSSEERRYCQHQGVHVLEIVLGIDAITLATLKSPHSFHVSRTDLARALSERQNPKEKPLMFWSDLHPRFPKRKIRFLGPSSNSGTRESFLSLIFASNHPQLRQDGVYGETSNQEPVILQKLFLEPESFGIFSFGFALLNKDRLSPLPIDGVFPSLKTILEGTYPLCRLLYLYVKVDHIHHVPGLDLFLEEFISAEATGEEGYLALYGFIPQPEEKRLREEEKIHRIIKRKP